MFTAYNPGTLICCTGVYLSLQVLTKSQEWSLSEKKTNHSEGIAGEGQLLQKIAFTEFTGENRSDAIHEKFDAFQAKTGVWCV